MTLKALLWDLDGTLLDTEHLWLAAETDVMAHHGYQWTSADQQHCLGGPIERVTAYMADRVNDGISTDHLAAELLESMEAHLRRNDPSWQPGSVELIRSAHRQGLQLALVTASHRRLLDALDETLEHTLATKVGMSPPVFTVTVAGDEVPATKPDPGPYLEAARRLGVDIRDCLVIEDSPTGVHAGIASGAPVIAVPHLTPITGSPRCRVVRSLTDVDLAQLMTWHADAQGVWNACDDRGSETTLNLGAMSDSEERGVSK